MDRRSSQISLRRPSVSQHLRTFHGMCSMCEGQTEAEYLDEIEGLVRDVGWAVAGVDSGEPRTSWLYTVGLSQTFGVPELVMVGGSTRGAHVQITHLVEGGIATTWGDDPPSETWAHGRLGIVPVHPSHWATDRFNVWLAHRERFPHDAPMRALQLLFADRSGRLPTESGVDVEVHRRQRRLDRPVAPNRRPSRHRARQRRRR